MAGTLSPSRCGQPVHSLEGATTIAKQQIAPGGQVTQFAYDNLDRLIAGTEHPVTGTCSQQPCNVITSYGYDGAGNRLIITDANQHQRSFQYDAADRQVASSDALNQPTSWDYDKGGRVLLQHDPRGTNYDVSYRYDALDRATQLASSQLDAPITTSYSNRNSFPKNSVFCMPVSSCSSCSSCQQWFGIAI